MKFENNLHKIFFYIAIIINVGLIFVIHSIKGQYYDDNKFIETKDFIKLCYEYPEYAYGFYRVLKARSGYKLDARVAKAAKFVDPVCPNYCPCCKSARVEIKILNIGY
ncbi:hypothetical protein BCR36DRAFT_185155 [Piromyces finnis]|uniref:Uncharacterized protein n=1 Tax=Piromyces finnis TaxID=1754191 RepID=A0A1Y1VG27_9FUNG|nr:hypothetical protein BCR36DRAFT_185155 [Piromyces finnis]|eukprot:ORX55376.1 hypothetical protein BCR36DRAFT_185155 [Piromyces finnis]